MYVEPWPADLIPEVNPPYFVRVPIYVTNDVMDVYDSICGFTIPLCYNHSNPSKYCSLSWYWNNTNLYPYPNRDRSIFRHIIEGTDTLVHNRMMDLSEKFWNWDTFILNLDDTSHFWLCMIPVSQGQLWWEGSRVLLATMTFKLEETMSICIDTCFWPPSSHLAWAIKPEGGGEAITKIPRPGTGTSSFEVCFNVQPTEYIRVTSPEGGEEWCVESTYAITWDCCDIYNVKIEYSTNAGTSWMTVTSSTPCATGSYSWTIPNTPSTNCLVRICDTVDNNPCDQSDSSFTIDTCCIFPTCFDFRDNTGDSYAIVVDSAFLDGLELRECDEIGVFDGPLCVGAVVYHPDSLTILLLAWEDDPLTPQKDGYTPGDSMSFKVCRPSEERVECALAHYSVGDGHFESGFFSQLWLEAPHPCEDIALYSGWQWISTNVDPNPCEMESIFVNCWGDLGIIIACDGSFCIPGVGCWIDCWKVCEMYKLHMADACTVEVCGSKVPTDNPCPLPAGWNCIAYFPECPLEPETALVSIWDNLDIVQNDAGEFCIPGVGCWIECMEYNEGYKIHLSSADTLVYPINCPPCPPPFAKKKSFPGFARTTHFNYSRNTGESYSIVVNSVELDGKHPEVGDEIGVFTSSELCVGAGVWQGDILGIAVWQDDDRTEVVDGFQVGEQMVFKLWDKDENKETELSVSFEKGDGKFGTVADPASGGDAYALVSLKGISSQLPERFELAQNYPNPFNPETKISYALPKDCHVKLTIYNMLGQKIKVLVDEHQTAGHKNVHWDGKDYKGNEVASGIYFFRIEAGGLTQSKKMVILK